MKHTLGVISLIFTLLFSVASFAADKVVVIPLGASGGGIEVPLILSGDVPGNGVIQGSNSNTYGYGVVGHVTGVSGRAVVGEATDTGVYGNYGGYFTAASRSGHAVVGYATNTGNGANFGGRFQARGRYGNGVYAQATGVEGEGVVAQASGISGIGVVGQATYWGASISYGGDFSTRSYYGRGVRGIATYYGGTRNYGGDFEAEGGVGMGVRGIASNTGAYRNYGGYFRAYGASGIGVQAVGNGSSGRGVYGYANGTSGIGVYGSGGQYDFYAGGPGSNYAAFTGSHEVRIANDSSPILPGMIVSVTGKTEVRKTDTGEIALSATLPTVTLSLKARDKTIFGVMVAEHPLPEGHWYASSDGERFGVVNALGEGRMWAAAINGEIEAGDYITSSGIPGYGQRQEDDLAHSYTIGKAIETVDWSKVSETVEFQGKEVKVYLIAVVYISG